MSEIEKLNEEIDVIQKNLNLLIEERNKLGEIDHQNNEKNNY